MGERFEDILGREPIFAITVDVDWASEACIASLVGAIAAHGIKPTIFVTHASAVLGRYQERGLAELALHPNFLPGSSHGSTPADVVAHVKELVPGARGTRSHAYAMSSHIIKALRPYVEYDSSPMCYLNAKLRPLHHGPGFVRYPVFWEDDAHWELHDNWDFSHFKPAFETPGLKIVDIHPFFYALNIPNQDFYLANKPLIETLGHDEMRLRRFAGRGCADFTLELLSWVGSSRYRCLCLSDLHDWHMQQCGTNELWLRKNRHAA